MTPNPDYNKILAEAIANVDARKNDVIPMSVIEDIKAELIKHTTTEYIPYTGGYTKRTINLDDALKIIDSHIRKEQA